MRCTVAHAIMKPDYLPLLFIKMVESLYSITGLLFKPPAQLLLLAGLLCLALLRP